MSQGKDKYDEIAEIAALLQHYGDLGGYGFENFEEFAPAFEQAVRNYGLIVVKISIEFAHSKVRKGKSTGFGLKYLLNDKEGQTGTILRVKKFIDDHYDGKFTNEQADEWIKLIQEKNIEGPGWFLKYESKMANKKPRTPEERERLVKAYLKQIRDRRDRGPSTNGTNPHR